MKKFYSSLDDESTGKLKKDALEKLAADFESLVKKAYPTILESFVSACRGFDDKLPVHYPRIQEEPKDEGKSFEWFVDNNKGRRLALPNLAKEIGLPINPKD